MNGKPKGKDLTKLTNLDYVEQKLLLGLEEKKGVGRGKVLGDSCLVTILGFVESVGEVDVVDDGSNIVLVEHVIDVKVVIGENVVSQFCCCGAVAEKV